MGYFRDNRHGTFPFKRFHIFPWPTSQFYIVLMPCLFTVSMVGLQSKVLGRFKGFVFQLNLCCWFEFSTHYFFHYGASMVWSGIDIIVMNMLLGLLVVSVQFLYQGVKDITRFRVCNPPPFDSTPHKQTDRPTHVHVEVSGYEIGGSVRC